jgi:hypothetical protein
MYFIIFSECVDWLLTRYSRSAEATISNRVQVNYFFFPTSRTTGELRSRRPLFAGGIACDNDNSKANFLSSFFQRGLGDLANP